MGDETTDFFELESSSSASDAEGSEALDEEKATSLEAGEQQQQSAVASPDQLGEGGGYFEDFDNDDSAQTLQYNGSSDEFRESPTSAADLYALRPAEDSDYDDDFTDSEEKVLQDNQDMVFFDDEGSSIELEDVPNSTPQRRDPRHGSNSLTSLRS